jgi:hypothetical protein
VTEFEDFLFNKETRKYLDEEQGEDLVDFVFVLDIKSKTMSKGYLWAIRYYYEFVSNDEMRDLATILREERIERKPFP